MKKNMPVSCSTHFFCMKKSCPQAKNSHIPTKLEVKHVLAVCLEIQRITAQKKLEEKFQKKYKGNLKGTGPN